MNEFVFPAIQRSKVEIVQVNLGYRCNQACLHCHVNAGPARIEMMNGETAAQVSAYLEYSGAHTLDVTGGAPELNPYFRELVVRGRALGARVLDRCNLTVLEVPGQEDLASFLAHHGVEIVASLPCYLEENVDRQRGKGAFQSSIRALKVLNEFGYGCGDSGLVINLVYNPQGPVLPPAQLQLEWDYKRHLAEQYGIVFNRLLTLANMPIGRFAATLAAKAQLQGYFQLLQDAHREENLSSVMCRSLVSIDWRGYVYDCDFNQMLDLPLSLRESRRVQVRDLIGRDIDQNPISVQAHCFGCTAGRGSSCAGALV